MVDAMTEPLFIEEVLRSSLIASYLTREVIYISSGIISILFSNFAYMTGHTVAIKCSTEICGGSTSLLKMAWIFFRMNIWVASSRDFPRPS